MDTIVDRITDSSTSETEDELEFPASRSSVDTSDNLCSICLEQTNHRDVQIPCGHIYHKECLRDLLKNHGESCALCRQEMSFNWLYQNQIVTRVSNKLYWRRVRRSFGPWPEIGPFVPSQQRLYNREVDGEELPTAWSRQWTADKKAELRMFLNLPSTVLFTTSLLVRLISRGRHGLPECTPQMLL